MEINSNDVCSISESKTGEFESLLYISLDEIPLSLFFCVCASFSSLFKSVVSSQTI